jgi:hypothetical protein
MAAALANMAAMETPEVALVAEHQADLKPVKGKKPRQRTCGASAPAPDSAESRDQPSAAASSRQRPFQVKSITIAHGLVARADLNGKRCVIIGSFSEARGRWPVRFLDSGEETLIKESNIVGDDFVGS